MLKLTLRPDNDHHLIFTTVKGCCHCFFKYLTIYHTRSLQYFKRHLLFI